MTVPRTSDGYIHPATHAAASGGPPTRRWACGCASPPATTSPGSRRQARAVAQALKTYGALVADNSGGNPNRIYISGATDLGWDDDDLSALKGIPASALEAVQTGPVIPAH